MSIVNAFIRHDVALVGVDTGGLNPDGSSIEASKIIFLPHLSAVIAFRGVMVTMMSAAPAILGFDGNFDQLAECMPEIMAKSMDVAKQHIDIDSWGGTNFVLVGYSPSAGRMVGHVFDKRTGEQEITVLNDEKCAIGPFWGIDDIKALNLNGDKASMVKLAHDQFRLLGEREEGWRQAGGGRFLIAEVRQGSINIEEAFRFPSRPGGWSGLLAKEVGNART